jgi:hypothetical protein
VITLALPTVALVAARTVELELLLAWRSPGAGAGSGSATGGGEVAWRWHHCVAARARVDSGALFERVLAPRAPLAAPTHSLPPALSRSCALVLAAPAGSHILHQLPRMLPALLGVRPLASSKLTNGGAAPAHIASGSSCLVFRSAHAASSALAIGGSGTVLEVSFVARGRCAEVVIAANGPAHDAAIAGAIGALRTAAPSGARLRVCCASAQGLDCLRRASLSLQAELAGGARACEAFLEAADAPTAAALPQTVGRLQSATDANASLLHGMMMCSSA